MQTAESVHTTFDSLDPSSCQRIYTYSMFPGDISSAGLRTTLCVPYTYLQPMIEKPVLSQEFYCSLLAETISLSLPFYFSSTPTQYFPQYEKRT